MANAPLSDPLTRDQLDQNNVIEKNVTGKNAANTDVQKVAAFFDIDNTIMRGASIYHLARGLFARKFLTASDLANYAVTQGKFLVAGSENMADMARITENALAFVAGRDVSEVSELANEIYDDIMAAKIWPGTVQLAQGHLSAGHQVWLVSAAPIELADLIAKKKHRKMLKKTRSKRRK